MDELLYIDTTIGICALYLLLLIRKRKNQLLIPCVVHTFTWLIACVILHFTVTGYFPGYNTADIYRNYIYVAPLILGVVISSIVGFSFARIGNASHINAGKEEVILIDKVEFLLKKYHWILYVCCIIGVMQATFIVAAVGFRNLGDYRVAAVTLARTGYGAFAQQFSGHATILGSFYFALLAYYQAYKGIDLRRFGLDAFLLSSTNMAIAGRIWIVTALLTYFVIYFWQANILIKPLFNKDLKKIFVILTCFVSAFAVVGMFRNDDGIVDEQKGFLNKFLYYTDGIRMTNAAIANFPEDNSNFEPEYGRAEFLTKWISSPMVEKEKYSRSFDPGLYCTVSSSLTFLYLDYGRWFGIVMWGIFCFLIEKYAQKMRTRNSIFSIFLFLELSKLLYQAPIGPIFAMEIPVIEWLMMLYIFRRKLKIE